MVQMSVTLWSQWAWLGALTLTSFLVIWIFADLLHLARIAYVSILIGVTAVFLSGYLAWSNIDWAAFLSQQWPWGLISGGASGLILIGAVGWLAR
jgi:di/tricarboxylate transporter